MPRIIVLSTLVGEYWRHLPHIHYIYIYIYEHFILCQVKSLYKVRRQQPDQTKSQIYRLDILLKDWLSWDKTDKIPYSLSSVRIYTRSFYFELGISPYRDTLYSIQFIYTFQILFVFVWSTFVC